MGKPGTGEAERRRGNVPSPRASSSVLCIGSAMWDVIGTTPDRLDAAPDVPGRIVMRPGGVAANIALALAAHGLRPALRTAFGDDGESRALEARLNAAGVDTRLALRLPGHRADRYMAIEAAGRLVAAIADAATLEAAGAALIAPLLEATPPLAPGPDGRVIVLVDGNLPAPVLARLARSRIAPWCDLRLVPASPGKVSRLAPFLAGFPDASRSEDDTSLPRTDAGPRRTGAASHSPRPVTSSSDFADTCAGEPDPANEASAAVGATDHRSKLRVPPSARMTGTPPPTRHASAPAAPQATCARKEAAAADSGAASAFTSPQGSRSRKVSATDTDDGTTHPDRTTLHPPPSPRTADAATSAGIRPPTKDGAGTAGERSASGNPEPQCAPAADRDRPAADEADDRAAEQGHPRKAPHQAATALPQGTAAPVAVANPSEQAPAAGISDPSSVIAAAPPARPGPASPEAKPSAAGGNGRAQAEAAGLSPAVSRGEEVAELSVAADRSSALSAPPAAAVRPGRPSPATHPDAAAAPGGHHLPKGSTPPQAATARKGAVSSPIQDGVAEDRGDMAGDRAASPASAAGTGTATPGAPETAGTPRDPMTASGPAPACGPTIYLNRHEAEILLGCCLDDAASAARALVAYGLARAIVTDGPAAAADLAAGDATPLGSIPPRIIPRQVTGAGDCFIAAHVAAEISATISPPAEARKERCPEAAGDDRASGTGGLDRLCGPEESHCAPRQTGAASTAPTHGKAALGRIPLQAEGRDFAAPSRPTRETGNMVQARPTGDDRSPAAPDGDTAAPDTAFSASGHGRPASTHRPEQATGRRAGTTGHGHIGGATQEDRPRHPPGSTGDGITVMPTEEAGDDRSPAAPDGDTAAPDTALPGAGEGSVATVGPVSDDTRSRTGPRPRNPSRTVRGRASEAARPLSSGTPDPGIEGPSSPHTGHVPADRTVKEGQALDRGERPAHPEFLHLSADASGSPGGTSSHAHHARPSPAQAGTSTANRENPPSLRTPAPDAAAAFRSRPAERALLADDESGSPRPAAPSDATTAPRLHARRTAPPDGTAGRPARAGRSGPPEPATGWPVPGEAQPPLTETAPAGQNAVQVPLPPRSLRAHALRTACEAAAAHVAGRGRTAPPDV